MVRALHVETQLFVVVVADFVFVFFLFLEAFHVFQFDGPDRRDF